MSREKTVAPLSTSGTSPCTIRRANPSAIAVLPTPASPTNSGLFFWRRQSTWMVRLISAARRPRFRHAGPFGDPVADVIDRVAARHVLLLQEIGGVAFALRKDRHQH